MPGTMWSDGDTSVYESVPSRTYSPKLTFIEHLLYAKGFTYFNSFDPHNDPVSKLREKNNFPRFVPQGEAGIWTQADWFQSPCP